MRRLAGVLALALLTGCAGGPSAELVDPEGIVVNWAVDRLGAFGLDEEGIVASSVRLPEWVWTNPETGDVVIAYLAPPCRQYPEVSVSRSGKALMVAIDPVTALDDDCSGPAVGWGLALELARPWTADDLVPRMVGGPTERG